MYALTRALQYELNISALSDNFGPATLAALESRFPIIDANTRHGNIYRILQSGLYCKGYDGGEIDGLYNERVSASVVRLKTNMGVINAYPGDGLTPKVFKGLLNMDPYIVVSGGTEAIRSVQQWLNERYISRRNFYILPCDGHFSRDVQKGLIYAIQFQLGMSDDVATGALGPATREGLRNHTLSVGSSGTWVNLFSAAMLFNRRQGARFTSTFDATLSGQVRVFQDFVKLPVTGNGDYQTWASLLVSTGDNTRRGTACDTVTQVTAARAQALRAAGYQFVGRYLSNVPGSTLNKMIQPGELDAIVAGGLRVFPIYQTWGGEASYFNYVQGTIDALAAIERARYYGFKAGTTIYFAVDFDALDYQVTDNIIPHFRGIADTLHAHSSEYRASIYGPRNVCSRVGNLGYVMHSFVSGMSTGFSGNLGYPLPDNWAFDQISTISVGSGAGLIEIDNNIVSGRDSGQNSFNPTSAARERRAHGRSAAISRRAARMPAKGREAALTARTQSENVSRSTNGRHCSSSSSTRAGWTLASR
jgi:peptidoglycan hydrolase-like protein with peptidoglycan-binding domain